MKRTSGKRREPRIGPVSKKLLESIGVMSVDDLRRVGAVEAYKQLKARYPQVTILMLYGLEGVLWGLHWNELPPELKDQLHEQVGYTPKRGSRRNGR